LSVLEEVGGVAKFVAGLAGAAVAIGLALNLGTAAADDLKKIKVTIPVEAFVFYALHAAQDQGYFKKEGLDVEIVSTNGDGPDVDALISGSVQFTVSTPNRLFMAAEQNKKLLAVMNLADRVSLDCTMNKADAEKAGLKADTPLIERMKLMKGLTVAGTRPGAFTYLMLVNYAKRAGLVPQEDVKVIGGGGPPALLAAMENGQLAVICTASPTQELAISRGKAVMLIDNTAGVDPAMQDFLFEMVYARPDFVKSDPDTVRHFLKGLRGGADYFVNTPVSEQMPALRARFTGMSDDMIAEVAEKTKKTLSKTGMVTKTAVDKAGTFLVDTGVVKKAASFEDVADNSFLPKP
jgi:NitT/TauT family transport system substrate-binding protein